MSSNIRVTRICHHCGNAFIAKTSVTQYCGDICAKRAYKQRIKDEKVEKSNKETLSLIAQPFNELAAKEFLSLSETAQLTGISLRTVQRLIEKGTLKAGKLGRRTIIKRKELDKLFQ